MWTPIRCPRFCLLALLPCALIPACSKAAPRVDAPVQQSAAASLTNAGCARDSLYPSAMPPAEGMWTSDGSSDGQRVSAMIGPTEVRTGSTLVTRTIETVEETSDATPLRARLDDAVVRVEFVPRYIGKPQRSSRVSHASDGSEPAAVYTLTPLVSLASYEACVGPPAVRYLRRDEHGGVANDAMLRRTSNLK